MKTIKIAGLLAMGVLSLAAVGCGKSKWVQSTEDWATATCACKDTACVTDQSKKLTDMTKDMGSDRGSQSDIDAITKSLTKGTDCITKISMAGVPGMGGH